MTSENGRAAGGNPAGVRRVRSGSGRVLHWVLCVWWISLGLVPTLLGAETSGSADMPIFTIGVSVASFPALNRNDISAALKVWAATVTRERRLQCTVRIELFDTWQEIDTALRAGRLDSASLTVTEFLASGLEPESALVVSKNGRFADEYVVLVREDSGIERLKGLKGKRFAWHASTWTALAIPWIEVELAKATTTPAEHHFASMLPLDTPSKAVLRVFFRQAEACLVTTNAFATAAELNPQLRRNLKVIAVSPPVVPSFFFMRPGLQTPLMQEMEAAILDLHATVTGQQVLTVFMGTRMDKQALSCLNPARELIAEHQRLLQSRGAEAGKGGSP